MSMINWMHNLCDGYILSLIRVIFCDPLSASSRTEGTVQFLSYVYRQNDKTNHSFQLPYYLFSDRNIGEWDADHNFKEQLWFNLV